MSPIDYDQDVPKHCVRYRGWLPACKDQKERTKNRRPLKYFTLCAKQAIDVFMLEMEGILQRDRRGCLPGVIVCEAREDEAVEIRRLVRPPVGDALIVGRLEDILTFQDTPETLAVPPDGEVRDKQLRRLLNIKRNAQRLGECFPFDVVNFDPYGSLVAPRLEANDLYLAFCRLFELQLAAEDFLLLLTTPVNSADAAVRAEFRERFDANVADHESIRDAVMSRHGTTEYDRINQTERVAVEVAKSIIIPPARANGWSHKHRGAYVYQRGGGHTMLSLVVEFHRGEDNVCEYVEDVVRIVNDMPAYYGPNDAAADAEVKKHLEEVITYREQVRAEYTS